MPSLSVVVPTRGRPQHIIGCLHAILLNQEQFDVFVVDQSDDGATQAAISALGDRRLHYVQSPLRGASNARNTGIDASRSEVIAFTDDDCRVKPDWVKSLLDIFANAEVSAVCGRVVVPEELSRRGYAAAFEPRERVLRGRFAGCGIDWGIAANLSVRRTALNQVGSFDPLLGAGASMPAGEEADLLSRLLRDRHQIVNAREVEVAHLGMRPYGPEVRKLWRAYGMGTGAALAKHVRLGDLAGILNYLRALGAIARWVVTSLVHGRLSGIGYLRSFVYGSLASFRFGVDRQTRMYIERTGAL